MQLTALQTIFLLLPSVLCTTISVSPSGSDSAAGTLAAPFKSIRVAINKAAAGDTIYLRGSTYSPTTNIQIKKSGTASAPITLSAYQSEVPIIDGEALPSTPAPSANYWKIVGLELKNGPYGVYAADSSNNVFERLVTHDNYETGFQLQDASANNKILCLDSYMNRDPRKNSESADGLGIKEGSGDGNIVKGERLWNNVDDGIDLWEFKSKITILDTISWGNGFNRWGFPDFAGDGNGFKLGGGDAADKGLADHNVTNSIAFSNVAKGFTDNSQPGNLVLLRNTAWNNTDVGFNVKTAVATLTSNIAAKNKASTVNANQVSLSSAQKASGNGWQASAVWTDASFKSVDTGLVMGKRRADGRIVAGGFLVSVSGAGVGATTAWS